MKKEYKDKIKLEVEKHLGRPASPDELINMQNDALLLARFLLTQVEQPEDRLLLLEKK